MLVWCLLFLSNTVMAADRAVEVLAPSAFAQPKVEELKEDVIYFSQDPFVDFVSWSKNSKLEQKILSPFPEYQEPTVPVKKDGVVTSQLEELTIYTTRMRTVINKAAHQIDLKKWLNIEEIAKLDSSIRHRQITAAETMPVVAGRKEIQNFQQCNENPANPHFFRHRREFDLTHLQRPSKPWCESPNSICVESCYAFNKGLNLVVLGVNKYSAEDRQKDYGQTIQSEIRFFNSESEYGQNVRAITKLQSPVQGIFELNGFYVNQILQYLKVLVVVQIHPRDNNKTIVSTFVTAGLRTRSLTGNKGLDDFIRGEGLLNTAAGLTAGIPKFSQDMGQAIVRMLNN